MKPKLMLYKIQARRCILDKATDMNNAPRCHVRVLSENPWKALEIAARKAGKDYDPNKTEYTVIPHGEPLTEEIKKVP
jgi:hypothetical protein